MAGASSHQFGIMNFAVYFWVGLFLPVAFLQPLFAGVLAGPDALASPPIIVEPKNEATDWGVFMGFRTASIPFATEDDVVTDIFPNFYYEGERYFLRGIEGGVRGIQREDWGLDLIGRYRFFDIPNDFQNSIRGDAFDMGLQAYRLLGDHTRLEAEVLSDTKGKIQAAGRIRTVFSGDRYRWNSHLEVRLKSSDYNTRYYGLDLFDVDAGAEVWAGVSGQYRVWRNLHLQGGAEIGWLDSAARDSPVVEDDFSWNMHLGFGFHEYDDTFMSKALKAQPYWRLSQGWGLSSSLGEIISGGAESEDVDVNMTSLFYGHPVSDTLFGLPIEVYLTPGVVYHYSSSVQDSSVECVLAMKFYYTLPLPWRVRFGFAEGISYANSVSYYEAKNMERKGLKPSRLLNYLDFSADLNIGDVFQSELLQDMWLGYAIHHRSGIFGSSSAFGRISGGSNFSSVYVQWSHGF